MPIRRVQQQSDRGNIKDLQAGDDEKYPPTSYESRLRDMYTQAVATRDQSMIDSLGFIVLNGGIGPVSVFRHREYVKQLEAKFGDQLEKTKQIIAGYLTIDETYLPREIMRAKAKQENSRNLILEREQTIKTASYGASSHIRRSFKRSS